MKKNNPKVRIEGKKGVRVEDIIIVCFAHWKKGRRLIRMTDARLKCRKIKGTLITAQIVERYATHNPSSFAPNGKYWINTHAKVKLLEGPYAGKTYAIRIG